MRISDWSSDVCSSDLLQAMLGQWFGSEGSGGGGDDPVLKSLPLPALVDIDFVGEDPAGPMEALRALVAREAPGARLIPPAEWLGPVARPIRPPAWLAAGQIGIVSWRARCFLYL